MICVRIFFRLRGVTPWRYGDLATCMSKQTVIGYTGFGDHLKYDERPFNKLYITKPMNEYNFDDKISINLRQV